MLSLEFGDYEASCLLRGTDKLVVSFAGIGDLVNPTPDYEWMDSLAGWSDDCSFIFIKDNSRSWYTNDIGIYEFALWLRNLMNELQFKESIAFGLSMGAYGAVIVDSLIHFDLVIALSSRSSVGVEADFDPRLESFSSKVKAHSNNNLMNLIRDDGTYIYLYSIDDPCDMMHAARLYELKKPNVRIFKTRGQHNIGYNIKKVFGLNSLFDWIFEYRCLQKHIAFTPFTDSTVDIAKKLEELGHPTELSTEDYNQSFQKWELDLIPRAILDNILVHAVDQTFDTLLKKTSPRTISCTQNIRLHLLPIIAYCHLNPEEFVKNLSFGWSDLEPAGCWAVGKWHFIEGHILGLNHSKHALAIEYDVYLPAGTTQIIRFYLNSVDLLICERTHEGGQNSGTVFIPLLDGFLSLLIETPNFTSPKSNNEGDDKRLLSLFVKSLTVIPMK